jgi:hypothetical protein
MPVQALASRRCLRFIPSELAPLLRGAFSLFRHGRCFGGATPRSAGARCAGSATGTGAGGSVVAVNAPQNSPSLTRLEQKVLPHYFNWLIADFPEMVPSM